MMKMTRILAGLAAAAVVVAGMAMPVMASPTPDDLSLLSPIAVTDAAAPALEPIDDFAAVIGPSVLDVAWGASNAVQVDDPDVPNCTLLKPAEGCETVMTSPPVGFATKRAPTPA